MDEGTTLKKKQLMVVQVRPIMGRGTAPAGAGLNFLGSTIITRFLFAVAAKIYARKGHRFRNLLQHLADQLADLFHHPVWVNVEGERSPLYFATLACKGDWPALVKAGRLFRNFQKSKDDGVCHLCMAGTEEFPHHEMSLARMDRAHACATLPWKP